MKTDSPYHPPYVPSRELHRMDMTFTDEGLRTIRSFKRKLSHDLGRPASTGEALDVLIKSHPFVVGNRPRRD